MDGSNQQAQMLEPQAPPTLVKNQSSTYPQSQGPLNFIFGIVFCTNLMINVDHGILPACTNEVKEDLKIDNANLGLLGSLVYAGLVAVCLLCNCGALILFTVSNEYYILVLSRLLVGFFQVFFCIYFPVWVDLFADEKRKTIWITLLLLGVPLGVILGYIMTAFLVVFVHVRSTYVQPFQWKWTFYLQAGFLIPLALCFMFTPARYIVYQGTGKSHDDTVSKMTESLQYYNLSNFESSKHYQHHKQGYYHRRDSSNVIPQSQQSQMKDNEMSPTFPISKTNVDDQSFTIDPKQPYPNGHPYLKLDDSQLMTQLMKNHSLDSRGPQEQGYDFRYPQKQRTLQNEKQEKRRPRANSTMNAKYNKQKERQMRKVARMVENYTMIQKIIYLLTNFNFMTLLLSLVGVYYLTTGVQFWITDYFIIVLGATRNTAFLTFASCALTGPVLGAIIGGCVINKLGGYNSPKAYPVCVVVMILASACGLPLVYVENFYLSAFLLWGQFFFGGFSLPVLTGILLNTCPESIRTIANSVANLFYNLLGYLPAPYIYGLVYEYYGGGTSRSGMFSLQIAGACSSGLMLLLLLKKKALEKEEKSKHRKIMQNMQGGEALELLDNDQIGPLLSQRSGELNLRTRKDVEFSSGEDSDDDYGVERQSFKTPVSDRIRLNSTSMFYSKSVYPLSLGIQDDE